MVRAKCPFCDKENDVGLLEEINPGDPTPMMKMCAHFVLYSVQRRLLLGLDRANPDTVMTMTPGRRMFGLTAHVASSVGWLGPGRWLLALAVAGLTSQPSGGSN